MPTVLMIHMGKSNHIPNGCEIYRGHQPLYHLRHLPGWEASWGWFEDYWQRSMMIPNYWESLIPMTDIWVFPRMVMPLDTRAREPIYWLFELLRSFGKKVVYEVDDDFTNEHRKVIEGDALWIASHCDAITVSTPHLKQLMEARTGKPAYVLPNCIDPLVWQRRAPRRKTDKLIIGLTGSKTHVDDWRVLESVLPRILTEFPDVALLIAGYKPDYLVDLPNTDYLDGMPYEGYSQIIQSCDVILAPVVPYDQFNLSKSPIKVIEGMGAERPLPDGRRGGAACLATDNPVYRMAIQHEKTGLLVEHTPDAWYSAIRRVITNQSLRLQLQKKGYNWVWQNHNIRTRAKDWAAAYLSILNPDIARVS